MPLEIPKRKQVVFNEVRGEYREQMVEDRPYRVLLNQFIEAGGIKRFFNDDGSRRDGSWPFDPDTAPAPRSKKKAKRKAKKKAKKKT